MFGHQSTRQIDLHLPTSWNRCTTEELEAIAAAIISEQQRVDRYHPFDWGRVKLNTVLSINSLTPCPSPKGEGSSQPSNISYQPSDISPKPSDIESTWLVKRLQDKEPWPITTGQLVALTEQLSWIDDEKASKVIFQFPYSTLNIKHETLNIAVSGPPPLLDGYKWREYRWMTEWMTEYMRAVNAKRNPDNIQRQFLAILFRAEQTVNERMKALEDEAAMKGEKLQKKQQQVLISLNALGKDPASLFTSFDPVKWQVILFWWSSLMQMLAKKFPRVFKSQPVGKGKRRPQKQDTPWDFYNRVTATIQKYIGGLSEQDVNNATYGTILQQLEMMADEAAEMEKIKNKK